MNHSNLKEALSSLGLKPSEEDLQLIKQAVMLDTQNQERTTRQVAANVVIESIGEVKNMTVKDGKVIIEKANGATFNF